MSGAGVARALTVSPIDRLQAKFSAKAQARLGTTLLAQGDSSAGFHHLSLAARRGSPEAQFEVGRCYLRAIGVPQNHGQAAYWLELAARDGHRLAQTHLAALLLEGFVKEGSLFGASAQPPDAEKSLYWARRAADAGDGEAQALVGHILSTGPDHLRNAEEAQSWYHRSAEGGCPQGLLGFGLTRLRVAANDTERLEAMKHICGAAKAGLPTAVYLLATFTADGFAVKRNPVTAATLFKKAAEMGVVAAQTRWGVTLLEGIGTARDLTLGELWLRRAALAEDAEAATRLGSLYTQGGEVAPNFAEAAQWLEQAAKHGRSDAARMLGQLYLRGAGVPRSVACASGWLQQAMLAGDELARTELGNLVLAGEAYDIDQSALAENFRAAAEAGDLFATFNYGMCLFRGIGVAPDWQEAIDWLTRSVDAVPEARPWIDDILARHGEEQSTDRRFSSFGEPTAQS